ncbi:YndM family protein [Psychrobacillus sp. FJAT-51614]|uniref:YndM family protein n=1 Tax=Psychrobacillus mangrovi TaxID=3117745 RepID=A0ABU8F9D9_9BACI
MDIKSFIIKLIMTTAVLWVVLGLFFGVDLSEILITSVVLTVIGYVADRFILPRIGNVLAIIGDFVLAFAVIWLLGYYLYDEPIALGTATFISTLILGFCEMYFHRYLEMNIFEPNKSDPEEKKGYYQRTNLQTEFAEEADIDKMSSEANDNKKDNSKSHNM